MRAVYELLTVTLVIVLTLVNEKSHVRNKYKKAELRWKQFGRYERHGCSPDCYNYPFNKLQLKSSCLFLTQLARASSSVHFPTARSPAQTHHVARYQEFPPFAHRMPIRTVKTSMVVAIHTACISCLFCPIYRNKTKMYGSA